VGENTFIWVVLVLLALEVTAQLHSLVGEPPPRKKGVIAIDVFVSIILIAWAATLLVT